MANRHRSHEEVTINLTPMIDIVFLLVIFFMVGAKFSESESRVNVSVATSGQMSPLSRGPDERKIDITASGSVLLDGQPISLPELSAILTAQHASYPDLQASVTIDDGLGFLAVDEVLRTIGRSGVKQLKVAARSNSAGGPAGGRGFRR